MVEKYPEYLKVADLFWVMREPRPSTPVDMPDTGHKLFAKDIMTAQVITARPDTPVGEIARLLIEHRISAVPVVDADGMMIGLVSESDLVHRVEGEYRGPRSWWRSVFGDPEDDPHEYARSHGSRASDIMTRDVISVSRFTNLVEIAEILDTNRIKRVPVLHDDKLVGIVSRLDVIRSLVTTGREDIEAASVDDREIRENLLRELKGHPWAEAASVNVVVADGVVRMFGFVGSDDARDALRIAAESIPGVVAVEDKLRFSSQLLTEL